MNLNKVFLLGNLTQDPEVRTAPSGKLVCRFRMATNRIWIDKNTKEKKQQTEYHTVVAWDKLANIVSQYLRKGRLVFVEGRITTRSWEDQNGTKRSRTEIIAENIQLGPRPKTETPPTQETPKETAEEEIPIIEEGEDIDVEEIPF